jgi:hypothetical protein
VDSLIKSGVSYTRMGTTSTSSQLQLARICKPLISTAGTCFSLEMRSFSSQPSSCTLTRASTRVTGTRLPRQTSDPRPLAFHSSIDFTSPTSGCACAWKRRMLSLIRRSRLRPRHNRFLSAVRMQTIGDQQVVNPRDTRLAYADIIVRAVFLLSSETFALCVTFAPTRRARRVSAAS